jgi:hypothetical protein
MSGQAGRGRVLALGGALVVGVLLALPVQAGTILGRDAAPGAAPTLPLPTIPPLPTGAQPLLPPVGTQPGDPASGCFFPGLGTAEMRQLYSLPASNGPSSAKPATLFGVDPYRPCHIYRSLTDHIDRSDASGQRMGRTYIDSSGESPLRRGPVSTSGVITAQASGDIFFYDVSGNNGVFHSSDYGNAWDQRDNGLYAAGGVGPTTGILALVPAQSNRAVMYLLGASNGATLLWRTDDGGQSWNALQPPTADLTTVAVDPANPMHVFASGGAAKTTTGGQLVPAGGAPDFFWESSGGGATGTWSNHPGPPGGPPLKLLVTNPHGTARVYATDSPNTDGSNQVVYRSFDDGAHWGAILVRDGLSAQTSLTFNPNRQDEMVLATVGQNASSNGVALAASGDGFATTEFSYFMSTPTAVSALEIQADGAGDYFLQRTLSVGGPLLDQLYAFRKSALAPVPPPPSAGPVLEVPRVSCDLVSLPPPAPGGQQYDYTSGSLAFDGKDLDYTQDTAPSGSNIANPLGGGPQKATGIIFRLDPNGCVPDGTITVRDDSKAPIFIQALTYDPRYVFTNGAVGAILAEGVTGQDKRVAEGYVPLYAVDPLSGTQELAAQLYCSNTGNNGLCPDAVPTTLTYDQYRDQIWAGIKDGDGYANYGLVALPAHRGAPAVQVPTCLTNYQAPANITADYGNSTWVVGSQNVLYVQLEDDTHVVRVDSTNCRTIGGFQHERYTEGADENDQMACDPITFGEGSPLAQSNPTSVIWIRNVHSPDVNDQKQGIHVKGNTVAAYPIPDGYCPFPTTLTMDKGLSARVGDVVTLCAALKGATAGQPTPLAGQTIKFTIGSTVVGTAQTDATGRACVTVAVPPNAGGFQIGAFFSGTQAYLPATAIQGLVVTANPAPPPGRIPGVKPFPPNPPPPIQPAFVPVPPVQVASQAQSQVQAQMQAQVQPGAMTQRQKQTRVALQRLDGGKTEATLQASRLNRETLPAIALQFSALALFGFGLYARDRALRRRQPKPSVSVVRARRR